MCRLRLLIALAVLPWFALTLPAQTPAPSLSQEPPQTARQALLEMVLAKTPDAFQKHLPSPAQSLLKTDPGLLPLRDLAEASNELHQPGRKLETFDTGPMLLRSQDPRNETTIEVSVESESDGGDEDELQLALHLYRAGRPLPLPFLPTIICRMKMEDKVWRLDEIAANLRMPLGDSDFLDTLANRIGAYAIEARESAALRQLRVVLTAEVSYAATYPDVGFTCVLSDLAGADAGQPGPRAAMLIDKELATGNTDGYVFVLEDCTGSPAKHFRLVAVPENPESVERAFCADESGSINFAPDGRASSCLSSGEALP
jgi:hypothetical protein